MNLGKAWKLSVRSFFGRGFDSHRLHHFRSTTKPAAAAGYVASGFQKRGWA